MPSPATKPLSANWQAAFWDTSAIVPLCCWQPQTQAAHQEDWTERGVAADLEEAGIPKSEIVLGFQPPEVRPFTEYAAA